MKTSGDKSIILKPKNVSVKNKGHQLVLIYHSSASASIWFFAILLLFPIYYASSNIIRYFSIESINQANYEKSLQEKIVELQATHLEQERNYRENIEKEYKDIDRVISSKEMDMRLEEMKERLGREGIVLPNTDPNANSSTSLEELQERKATLASKIDSIKKAGEIDSLSTAEIDAALQDWKSTEQRYIKPSTDELINFVIMPIGIILICLLVFRYIYKWLKGDDVLVVDKQRQIITRKKDNQLAKAEEFSIANVKQFFCKKRVSGGEHARTYHYLIYIDEQDEQHELLSLISNAEDAIYMEHQIEEFLGIEHVHVRGGMN